MKNDKIDKFFEENNDNYLYLLLANLEVKRLSALPHTIKENFSKKITVEALNHVVDNDIPDYITAEEEFDIDDE